MVAKITVPASIKRALNYNEQKAREGLAKCIYAHNFLQDADCLNFYAKLLRFEKLISLNKRASTNTVHISLNFAAHENLNKEKLGEIARVYMEKIGFNKQPYLVYEHYDAAHPHVHIVTTTIQKNGKRISIHNLGKNESSLARKEIEIEFGLVKAEEQRRNQTEKIVPIDVQKIIYGKSPTKRAISNVLNAVLSKYKYATLAELNAVLKLYNMVADKGAPGSKIEQNHGLVYRVLDANGDKTGVPIKASSISGRPTLRYLEKKFAENETLKQPFKKSVSSSIDWVLLAQHKSLASFQKALEKEKITLVTRQNAQGIIYGLTYIDHSSKTVFNGSDIGKQYSAKAILEKCSKAPQIENQIADQINTDYKTKLTLLNYDQKTTELNPSRLLETVITPIEQYGQLPYRLKGRKKKKRKSQ
jgi:hypothetical protein